MMMNKVAEDMLEEAYKLKGKPFKKGK